MKKPRGRRIKAEPMHLMSSTKRKKSKVQKRKDSESWLARWTKVIKSR